MVQLDTLMDQAALALDTENAAKEFSASEVYVGQFRHPMV
jgi:hypothetical protein